MRRPGFSIPGYAARAGRKAHELGAAHQWTPEEARQAAAKAVEKRQEQRATDAPVRETRNAYAV